MHRTVVYGLLSLGLSLPSLSMAQDNASCATGAHLEGGRSYQVRLPTHDGYETSFQVLEPDRFDCANRARGAHPLVLDGPGYAGGRSTGGFADWREAGYTVISWDPRGFGDSGGTVRVMDPEFEGQDLLTILDWAEQNLDYLAWRDERSDTFVARPTDASSVAGGVNLVLGALGGSYGGGYQMLLLTVDPKNRLDAITPEITWHDLRDALNPGDVQKSLWNVLLIAVGENAGHASNGPPLEDGQDPFIKETTARAIATGEFSRQALDWFHYHGLGYWCAANGLPAMPYPDYAPDLIPMIDVAGSYNVPPRDEDGRPGLGEFLVAPADPTRYFEGLDVLIVQGMIDTLFNYNQAWWNAQCLRAAGARVNLYTHNGGHVLPTIQSPDKLTSDTGTCGADRRTWMDARLRGRGEVALADTCFALGTEGDSITMPAEAVLAPQPLGGNAAFTVRDVAGMLPLGGAPAVSGAPGLASVSGQSLSQVSLGTVDEELILAGIPHLNVTVATPAGLNELVHETAGNGPCMSQPVPLRSIGCDSILYVGLGRRTAELPTFGLIDDQIQPLRGLGRHDVDLVGVAERLHPGDELALLFYAAHPQYFGSASRDLLSPVLLVSGTVDLPLYAVGADGQAELGTLRELLPAGPATPPAASGIGRGGSVTPAALWLLLLAAGRRLGRQRRHGLLAAGALTLLCACQGEQPGPADRAAVDPGDTPGHPYGDYQSENYSGTGNWLCHPDNTGPSNYCRSNLDTLSVVADGTATVLPFEEAAAPTFDCLYYYPTTSLDPTPNSDFIPDIHEIETVRAQAARYAQHCRVFAPLYRQVTLTTLIGNVVLGSALDLLPVNLSEGAGAMAYADVLDAFKQYIVHESAGRGFVLIGHSQGAGHLKRLIAEEIEPDDALHARMISAHLTGTSVAVPIGRDVGGHFFRTPGCRRADQYNCVVSYSTFRAGDPFLESGPRFGVTGDAATEALCTNPAALAGGEAVLDPRIPFQPPPAFQVLLLPMNRGSAGPYDNRLRNALVAQTTQTRFYSVPDQLRAECMLGSESGVSYLELRIDADPNDPRADDYAGEFVGGNGWGLHLLDMQAALGDLVELARQQAWAWQQAQK